MTENQRQKKFLAPFHSIRLARRALVSFVLPESPGESFDAVSRIYCRRAIGSEGDLAALQVERS